MSVCFVGMKNIIKLKLCISALDLISFTFLLSENLTNYFCGFWHSNRNELRTVHYDDYDGASEGDLFYRK